MKPGRNDPCPCGSGKKYKQCCMRGTGAAVETPEEFLRRRIRNVTEDLTSQLLGFAHNQLGEAIFDEAWADFAGSDEAFDPKTPHLPVFDAVVLLWLVARSGGH